MLFLDLGGFKHVNDSLGHLVGDQLLVAIAKRLETRLSVHEPVARIGGDEFAVLVDSARDIDSVVEKIRSAFRRPFQVAGRDLFSDASIGAVRGGAGYSRPEEVLRDADSAMYRAKAKGRNVSRPSTRPCCVSRRHGSRSRPTSARRSKPGN